MTGYQVHSKQIISRHWGTVFLQSNFQFRLSHYSDMHGDSQLIFSCSTPSLFGRVILFINKPVLDSQLVS